MSSSTGRSDRPTRQDYVARIRYVNNLPPPPIPPKFLNVPGTGLPNDVYTSASYASRLVRDQPINVEADAELGMPIDLVGMPGVFDGDETCISALSNPPPPHPHDEPLLKPLSALRRADTSVVSFLRKTDYMSSNSNSLQMSGVRNPTSQKAPLKRKHDEISKDDPARIMRDIDHSFDLANGDVHMNGDGAAADSSRDNWANPKHPNIPSLKLLDTYPLLPDLDAMPEGGSYSVTKYSANPVSSSRSDADRLDAAILVPRDPRQEVMQLHRSKQAERIEKGQFEEPLPYDYDLFLTEDGDVVDSIKRNKCQPDPEGTTSFEFRWKRSYETSMQNGNKDEPFDDTVAMVLYDGQDAANEGEDDSRKLAKGAYFYPIGTRNVIRPERGAFGQSASQSSADILDVTFRPPIEDELRLRQDAQAVYRSAFVDGAAA